MAARLLQDDPVEVLVVHLDGVRYALPLQCVIEVLPAVASVPLPGAPEVVEGLLNVRGRLVPLLDLRGRLGAHRRPGTLSDHIVVCAVGDRAAAVRVDRADEVLTLSGEGVEQADVLATTSHLSGVVRLADGMLLVYDVASFLSADEALGLDAALAAAGPGRQP